MRDILVVIDMQNDFIDGALGTDEAISIVDDVVERIEHYDTGSVFATMDTHTSNYLDTQEGKNVPVKHCIKGEKGWKINSKIAPLIKEENIFEKPTFGSVDLANHLNAISQGERIRITLIGVCTDICVASNALLFKAFMPEVPIRIIAKCCAGVTPATHESALTTLEQCQMEILR